MIVFRHSSRALSLIALLALVATNARAASPTVSACLAANESSIQLRNSHKLNDSRAQLLICTSSSCPTQVSDACQQRLIAVNAAIPTLVFEAKDAAGNDLSAVAVTLDGAPLVDHLDGTALSFDPGEHTFTFEFAGQKLEKHLVLNEGEKERREPVIFGAAAPPPPPPPTAASVAEPPPPPTAAPPPASAASAPANIVVPPASTADVPAAAPAAAPTDSSTSTAGYIIGGAGMAALVVGGIFGSEALAHKHTSDNDCPSDNHCSSAGVKAFDDAKSDAWVADFGVGLGLVGVSVGAYLLLSAPSPPPVHAVVRTKLRTSRLSVVPQVAPGRAGLSIGGVW